MTEKKGFFAKRGLRADVSRRTTAAELTVRQSIVPLMLVTSLFFLWGFSYGLLDTLNRHFQNTLNITQARSAGLQAAYFGAYPLASIGHAAWILRHFGYRAVFIYGLLLYALGALLAIPTIIYRSFGGFCVCIFIIGSGLGSLETAANPYLVLCGPPKYAEIRINLAQAFNGIGTVIAPVLGAKVLFTFSDAEAEENVQWIYLSVAVFVLIIAGLFFVAQIPEMTDADTEFANEETQAGTSDKPFIKQYKLFHAAFAQFCYTGAQVAIASSFITYTVKTRPGTSDSMASNLFAGAQAAFTVGRFVGTFLMRYIRPRWIFLVFLTMCIIFSGPAITQGGNIGVSMLFVILFFESVCFPTIVALGMKGLGRHSKRGSGWIVAGVSGGAAVPPLLGVAADNHGNGVGMVVPLIFFAAAWTYALAVNFSADYKSVVDPFGEATIGMSSNAAGDVEKTGGDEKPGVLAVAE